MSEMETFESRLREVMASVAEAAVTELRRLTEEQRADVEAVAAEQRSAPATPRTELWEFMEEVGEVYHLELDDVTIKHFAALMETWTRGAAEKILEMLKGVMCEFEEGQRSNHNMEEMIMTSTEEHETEPSKPNEDTLEAKTSSSSAVPPVLTPDLGEERTKTSTTAKFQCPSCEKTFALKYLMDRHRRSHSKPHLCPQCGKGFSLLSGLMAHSRRHTGEKLHKCPDCGTEFAYKSTFTRHMRQHAAGAVSGRVCTLCEKHFSGTVAFQRHQCGALKKTFVCSLCPQTFDSRQSLSDHENLHSGDRRFVCEECGESFFSSSSLATHRVTHLERDTCCEQLGVGCSHPSVLARHLSKHSGEKLFSCQVCGKGLSHQSALKHHMLKHTGERPFVCEVCGKSCSHASALQNHMRLHTGRKPGELSVCSVCGKGFRCATRLKYHMSVHTGEKPYACDQCDKSFSNPSNLRCHMRRHSGQTYGCNVCGRRFTQANSLKLHRLVHTGERPHRCAVCGKEFIKKSTWRRHQGSHQAGGAGTQT